MARNKNKPEGAISKLELFNDDQPLETTATKQQIEVGQGELQAEPAPPKKRGRKKKTENLPAPTKSPELLNSEQPSTSIVSLPLEKFPAPQLLAVSKLNEEKEDQLKEKYKKQQEERLAALRRVRGNK